ncbi:MAG: DNA cytosine methyltransferase [Flavobacteriales bacterium]
MNEINVFSLFTGGGGLDIGFEEAGFNIIGASDIWKESMETMKLNSPKCPFILKDINLLTKEDILLNTNGVKPDVIIGGPPCQGFSVMGDKNSADPRNKLFESYVRIVNDLKPKCFVFENVRGMKTLFNGRYFDLVVNSFTKIGYHLHFDVLDAKDYGVPQSRKRVIIFGSLSENNFNFPSKSLNSFGKIKSYKNVGAAINDLINENDSFPNHIPLNHKEIVLARYKLIPEGGKLPPPEQLPPKIRRKNFGNTYCRLHREKISTTMVPGNNAFPVHPTLDRSLTPREAARIQTFPDNHIFIGTRQQQCKLVGNAVPPLLSAKIANKVYEHLLNNEDNKSRNQIKSCLSNSDNNKVNTKNGKKFKDKYTFIDLFSGAGGIGIGFENAGYQHIFSADFDPAVGKTFRHNFPNIPFIEGDLSSDITFNIIKERFKGKKIDVIVGGPPCQGFSSFGNRKRINKGTYDPHKDPRNKLIFTYLKYVKLFQPRYFIMENVKGILSLDNGWFIENLLNDIKKIGYQNVEFKIINTADYGVPQKRLRFILIANRTGNIIPWPKPKFFEKHINLAKVYRTVGSVIMDLAPTKTQKKVFNHNPMNHSQNVKDRFSYINEGCKLVSEDLPEHLKYSRTGNLIKGFSKVFFRLDRNKPSHTLVPGHSAFPIHPFLNRQLTVREAARIQTFPDNLEFLGTHGQQCKQVGNAFPPLAAEYFANIIAKSMSNDWKEESTSKLAYYSLVDEK